MTTMTTYYYLCDSDDISRRQRCVVDRGPKNELFQLIIRLNRTYTIFRSTSDNSSYPRVKCSLLKDDQCSNLKRFGVQIHDHKSHAHTRLTYSANSVSNQYSTSMSERPSSIAPWRHHCHHVTSSLRGEGARAQMRTMMPKMAGRARVNERTKRKTEKWNNEQTKYIDIIKRFFLFEHFDN